MADIDPEVVARVARWCAEAGRQAGSAQIRAALAPLGWDELLVVKALLADPPPARPLGPFALADLARGAPADVAAEREREGRYAGAEAEASAGAAGTPEAAAPVEAPPEPKKRRTSRSAPRAAQIVVHRAKDRVREAPPSGPTLPLLDTLRVSEGRAVLERLIRRHGGRRAALLAAVSEGWRRADGAPVSDSDLAALLDEHGLARAYARREHDEVLHALRAAAGVRVRAAVALGIDAAGLDAALARLGASDEAERIRDERRRELRARGTLADRAHLVLEAEERLADLGVLDELDADLRARLPEHVRALRAGPEPLHVALSRTLSLAPAAVDLLARRYDLELGPAGAADNTPRERRPAPRPDAGASRPPFRGKPSRPPGRPGGPRPTSRRPGGPRSGPGGAGRRPGGPRTPGARPAGARAASGSVPPRSGPSRSGPSRSGPPRSGPPRSGPPRSGPPRSGPPRSGAPRPGGSRSGPRSGPRRGGPRAGKR